jgi:hypothetical protein
MIMHLCQSVAASAQDRLWHEAAVRKCPLLRRLWGLSGHRSASSIYEYTSIVPLRKLSSRVPSVKWSREAGLEPITA